MGWMWPTQHWTIHWPKPNGVWISSSILWNRRNGCWSWDANIWTHGHNSNWITFERMPTSSSHRPSESHFWIQFAIQTHKLSLLLSLSHSHKGPTMMCIYCTQHWWVVTEQISSPAIKCATIHNNWVQLDECCSVNGRNNIKFISSSTMKMNNRSNCCNRIDTNISVTKTNRTNGTCRMSINR